MKKNQKATPLLEGIENLIASEPAYFRIPGHRLERGISNRWTDKVGKEIFAYDVTETPYTDDLHSPQGCIKEAQELLSDLYHTQKSFFLVNGTTCGNEAMIISSAWEGQKILIARNAHKSAMMGLIISGAKPVYIMPEILDDWGLQGGISPKTVEKAFKENPDCKALFLVSPSYYGICSDLERIAEICHEYNAMLLVDEAHGGHVYFNESLPQGAMQAGADMCVQSMHKVTGALTQSSVLHVNSKLLNNTQQKKIAENLHIVQSTSPSYLLMASLDCARYELAMHGNEMMEKALRLAEYARNKINSIYGFKCMTKAVEGKSAIAQLDTSRLVISAKALGISGFELEIILFEEYQINMELSDYENVLAVITYANTDNEIERLIEACKKISQKESIDRSNVMAEIDSKLPPFPNLPVQIMTPREAYFADYEEIPWENAIGRISAEMVAPYPPGIPVIYPGECIDREVWEYVQQFVVDKRHIHGLNNGKIKTVRIN